ncbi:MAG: hypothetical protein RRY95_05165 [Oscillospiraceae bacterium]
MGYESYLQDLLAPLGIYARGAGTLHGAELGSLGAELDRSGGALDRVERESLTATAEEEGLSRREALFARRPAATTTARRREAIAALNQIDGDSFTLDDINHAITGCGIHALAQERPERGHIRVIFPEVSGVPPEIEQIEQIILDIMPCHLETEFYFRFLTWLECEARGLTWASVEAAGHTWRSLELSV